MPISVTPIWAVARNRSTLSWSARTRWAARLPPAISASIRLLRAERIAISLPEKNPFPTRHNKIAATSRLTSLMD